MGNIGCTKTVKNYKNMLFHIAVKITLARVFREYFGKFEVIFFLKSIFLILSKNERVFMAPNQIELLFNQ